MPFRVVPSPLSFASILPFNISDLADCNDTRSNVYALGFNPLSTSAMTRALTRRSELATRVVLSPSRPTIVYPESPIHVSKRTNRSRNAIIPCA